MARKPEKCKCGCGDMTKGGLWLPGHNAPKRERADRTPKRQRRPRPVTVEHEEAFLARLSDGDSIALAATACGFDRRRFYEVRERESEFADLWDAAVETGTDKLEDEARRRGVDGVEEPVYQGGKLVGMKQKYSDVLLLALLNARRPEKFRQNHKVEHGGRIEVMSVDAIDAEIARLSLEMQGRAQGEPVPVE